MRANQREENNHMKIRKNTTRGSSKSKRLCPKTQISFPFEEQEGQESQYVLMEDKSGNR